MLAIPNNTEEELNELRGFGIPTGEQWELLHSNPSLGPHSAISCAQRIIRGYKLGILTPKQDRNTSIT